MKTFDDLSNELDEVLSVTQRLARRRSLKKNKAKIARGRRVKQKRLATRDTLKLRASREARNTLFKRLTGGKGKGAVGFAQRKAVEKQLLRKSGVIKKLATRLLPATRKKEITRLQTFRSKGRGDK